MRQWPRFAPHSSTTSYRYGARIARRLCPASMLWPQPQKRTPEAVVVAAAMAVVVLLLLAAAALLLLLLLLLLLAVPRVAIASVRSAMRTCGRI